MKLSARSASRLPASTLAVAASAFLLVSGLAACGDDSDTSLQGAGTTTETTTAAQDGQGGQATPPAADSTDPSTAGEGTYPDVTGECLLFDPAQIDTVVGEAAVTESNTSCSARGPARDSLTIRETVFVGNTMYGDLETFRSEHDGDDMWTPVPGIGDAAYYASNFDMTEQPAMRVANGEAFATIDLNLRDDDATDEEIIEMLSPIGATAADRMPVRE